MGARTKINPDDVSPEYLALLRGFPPGRSAARMSIDVLLL